MLVSVIGFRSEWLLLHVSQELNLSLGLLARYLKLRVAHVAGMPGTFYLPPQVRDTNMHHDTCAMHVPWCMLGSLTFLWSRWQKKNVPSIPSVCATGNFTYLVRGPCGVRIKLVMLFVSLDKLESPPGLSPLKLTFEFLRFGANTISSTYPVYFSGIKNLHVIDLNNIRQQSAYTCRWNYESPETYIPTFWF